MRIYEFVRNEVANEWYNGAMKGAVATLHQRRGNDVDQAALLVALLRAAQLPARYVHGVIEVPLAQVGQDFGLAEPAAITRALAASGVAFEPLIRGGRVAALRLAYTWVTAQVPYANYRGAVVDRSGPVWVPLATGLAARRVFARRGAGAAVGYRQ